MMKLTIWFNIDLDSRVDSISDDLSNILKLEDAKLASTEDSNKYTLILTEDDCAKALVVSWLSLATSLFLTYMQFEF
jgi:hypothetical protein